MSVAARILPDGRLHLQHGPIDLVVSTSGEEAECRRAYRAAVSVFPGILPRLVEELALLRAPVGECPPILHGPVARRMAHAVWPWRADFVTPMAAVAGAVADHVLLAMRKAADCRKIVVNNGGDIAFHLADGETLTAGIVGVVDAPSIDARLEVGVGDPIRGLATSGWRGRSQSLGIADAVTALAKDAATADAAATMIANAVDVSHPAIGRLPAREVKDDSDLGQLLVTVAVGALPEECVAAALDCGVCRAQWALDRGLIGAAYLRLQGAQRIVGALESGRLAARAA
jgi:ApbE superfamily uncharacterized protein (UPF0280 family)